MIGEMNGDPTRASKDIMRRNVAGIEGQKKSHPQGLADEMLLRGIDWTRETVAQVETTNRTTRVSPKPSWCGRASILSRWRGSSLPPARRPGPWGKRVDGRIPRSSHSPCTAGDNSAGELRSPAARGG